MLHVYGLKKLILLKCPFYQKQSTNEQKQRCNAISFKMSITFFTEIEKKNSIVYMGANTESPSL